MSKRISCVILSLFAGFLLFFSSLTSYASELSYMDENYTYMVRIYAGGQGTFADGTTEMVIQATPGTVLDLSGVLQGVVLNPAKDAMGNPCDNKYYAKGIRESGKDNQTVSGNFGSVFRITRDADYVVAYGMKGGDVAYTVKYLEKDTMKELFPQETFYGNVGERPVIAYQYLAGYFPQAYNLTKTLVEDPQQNIFIFYYQKGDGGRYEIVETDGGTKITYVDGGTTVDFIPGTTVVVNGGGGGVTVIAEGNGGRRNGGGTPVAGYAAVAGGNEQADAGLNNGGTTIEDEETPLTEAIPTLIDIGDEDTPLYDGNFDLPFTYDTKQEESSTILPVLFVAIGVVAIAIVVTGITVFTRRRKALWKQIQDLNEDKK